VQQGDPFGILLFNLMLEGALKDCTSEFIVAYLDDVTLGDTLDRLADQVLGLKLSVQKIGLSLNLSKSEAWPAVATPICTWKTRGLQFSCGTPGMEKLLGAPLRDQGVANALAEHRKSLARFTSRL